VSTLYDIEYTITARVRVRRTDDKIAVVFCDVDEFDPYDAYRAAIVAGGGDDPEFVRYPEFYADDKPVVDHIASLGWEARLG
jgi:hypothetical protein